MGFESISQRILDKTIIDFGSIFSNSIELFKKVWLQGFVTILLTMLCTFPIILVVYIPLIAIGIIDPEMMQQEEPSLPFVLAMMIVMPMMMLGVMTISLALTAAFFRICMQKDLGLAAPDDYFYYFKNGRLRKVIILALLSLGISILGFLACGIGVFYVVVPISLIPAFLAFNADELSPMEIVKLSFQLGNKNWLMIFLLLIVMGILAELGVFLCVIGIFFTAMLAKIPTYHIYKDGVGFSNEATVDNDF